jgi:hypothetical protein
MKKLLLFTLTILTAFGLVACDSNIVDIPIDPEVETPAPVIEEPQVEEPSVVTPEVVIEYIDRFIEVPANVERLRRYQPGTYTVAESSPNSQNGYVFAVVTVDDYGMISSVYIDQTISTRVLHQSPEGDFYVFVEGNGRTIPNSYRRIDPSLPITSYPTIDDAIRTSDLSVGIDNAQIRLLQRVAVNETKQIASSRIGVSSALSYAEQMRAVANKVVFDNTTYGFNLVNKGDIITTSSIEGIDQPLDVPLALIQSLLDGPAALTNPSLLSSRDRPNYGVYLPGTYIEYSTPFLDNGSLNHALSIVTVDRFGRIISTYLDETTPSVARSSVFATKKILGDVLKAPNSDLSWTASVKSVEDQVVFNQGIDGFLYEEITSVGEVRPTLTPFTSTLPVVVSNIPQNTVAINHILLATRVNLTNASTSEFYDGVYLVQDPVRNEVAIVTLEEGLIIDVVFDRFIKTDQAQLFRQNQVVTLQEFPRTFGTPAGSSIQRVSVYQIGVNTYAAEEITHLNNVLLPVEAQIKNDQLITLSLQERQQLQPVGGFQPATQLTLVDPIQQNWVNQARLVADALIDAGRPTSFQITRGQFIEVDGVNTIPANSFIRLVNQAYQLAKTPGNQIQTVRQNILGVPLAEGSYLTYQTPTSEGVGYTYMSVRDGQVRSWVVDQLVIRNESATTLLRSNITSDTSIKTELTALSNELVAQQTNWITTAVVKPSPNPQYESIRGSISSSVAAYSNSVYRFIPVLNQVITQASEAKLAEDMETIYQFFMQEGQPLFDPQLIAFQTKTRWLPSSITSKNLSYLYALEWRTESRDLRIRLDGAGYTFEVERLDNDVVVPITLEIFLPGTTRAYISYTYNVSLQRRATFGQALLNSRAFDLPSLTLLESTAFTLPTSSDVSIVWRTSDAQVISATGQTAATTTERTATLTAFVDLDGNGQFNANEPAREYNVRVLPKNVAVQRVIAELDTNQIAEFINPELTLSTVSSVWGLTYSWASSSPQVRLAPGVGQTSITIAKSDFPMDIPLTAVFNLPNTTHTQIYRLDAGSPSVYEEFTIQDLPTITVSNDMIPGQSIFDNYSAVGLKYGSSISFITTDFGQFVNPSGIIIYQHPTEDACFEVRLTARYSGGVNVHSTTVTESFCVLSTKSLQARMNLDKDALTSIVIDRSTYDHVDLRLSLPTTGSIYAYPVRYALKDGQTLDSGLIDVSLLSSGILLIQTTEDIVVSQSPVVLVATIEVPLHNGAVLRVTRDISVVIKE